METYGNQIEDNWFTLPILPLRVNRALIFDHRNYVLALYLVESNSSCAGRGESESPFNPGLGIIEFLSCAPIERHVRQTALMV
jgi:hypothetical protein